jgi:hypothetical protein
MGSTRPSSDAEAVGALLPAGHARNGVLCADLSVPVSLARASEPEVDTYGDMDTITGIEVDIGSVPITEILDHENAAARRQTGDGGVPTKFCTSPAGWKSTVNAA